MLRVGVCCVFAVEGFSAVMIGPIKMLTDDSPAVLKEISHIKNCEIAGWPKKLMSRTSPLKFRVFRRKFLRKHTMNWTQIVRENSKTVMRFQYSEFLFY